MVKKILCVGMLLLASLLFAGCTRLSGIYVEENVYIPHSLEFKSSSVVRLGGSDDYTYSIKGKRLTVHGFAEFVIQDNKTITRGSTVYRKR